MIKIFYAVIIAGIFACNDKKSATFSVNGNLKNTTAKTVYLELNIPNHNRYLLIRQKLKRTAALL